MGRVFQLKLRVMFVRNVLDRFMCAMTWRRFAGLWDDMKFRGLLRGIPGRECGVIETFFPMRRPFPLVKDGRR